MSDPKQTTFAEAEFVSLLLKAQGHATAFANTLTDATSAARTAGLEAERDADKVLEYHRVVMLRLGGLIRRITEGA